TGTRSVEKEQPLPGTPCANATPFASIRLGACPRMNDRLQAQLFGSYFGSFLPHSYGYEAANEPKSALKLLDFRFGPYSRTSS
ncbi:MAG: hypothetical protein U9R69_06950, partial [Thermodesulfobacteriota bacterium]|nr:hypothetical protein [Thermodesulfobacteriota bacterium]